MSIAYKSYTGETEPAHLHLSNLRQIDVNIRNKSNKEARLDKFEILRAYLVLKAKAEADNKAKAETEKALAADEKKARNLRKNKKHRDKKKAKKLL